MARGPESDPPGVSIWPAKTTRPTNTVQYEKYSELVARLVDDFQQRFEDFRKHIDIMILLSNPFQVDPKGAAVKYKMEPTDIQNDSDLKRASVYTLLQLSGTSSHSLPAFSLFVPTNTSFSLLFFQVNQCWPVPT